MVPTFLHLVLLCPIRHLLLKGNPFPLFSYDSSYPICWIIFRKTWLQDQAFSRKEVGFGVFFSNSRRKHLSFNKALSSRRLITTDLTEGYFSIIFDTMNLTQNPLHCSKMNILLLKWFYFMKSLGFCLFHLFLQSKIRIIIQVLRLRFNLSIHVLHQHLNFHWSQSSSI